MTGVQTCALPISANLFSKTPGAQIGTSTGNLAGGLSAYRMLQEREREALPPEY